MRRAWPLERVLFALAGSLTVGVNQWLFVGVGSCPASLVLERGIGIERAAADERARKTRRGLPPCATCFPSLAKGIESAA